MPPESLVGEAADGPDADPSEAPLSLPFASSWQTKLCSNNFFALQSGSRFAAGEVARSDAPHSDPAPERSCAAIAPN